MSDDTTVVGPAVDASALLAAAREGYAAPQDTPPPPPDAWQGRARVRLWQRGRIVAIGVAIPDSPDDSPVDAVRAAAAAARALAGPTPPDADTDDDPPLHFEIEVVDSIERIEPEGLSGLLQSVRPAVHGLVLHDDDRVVGGWPSDPMHEGRGVPDWVKALLKQARPPGYWLPSSLRVERFTARRLAAPVAPPDPEPDAEPDTKTDTKSDAPDAFVGDTRLVALEDVTTEKLRQAASWAGAWLVRHQRSNGLFAYQYVPHVDAWSPTDSIVRQAGCAWSLVRLTRVSGDRRFAAAALRAVTGILSTALRRDGPGGLSYVAGPDGARRLGAVPLLLLALDEMDAPTPRLKPVADELTKTILAIQERSGALGTSARGMEFEGSERYFAGQCALALAKRYRATNRRRLRDAGDKALIYYRDWWDGGNEDLSFLAWMIQACDAADAADANPQAVDFAFTMADWALQSQFAEDHPDPAWVGGYRGGPGIGTAAYTEGMVSALAIARRRGDADRARRYERSVLLAMRFLLQLQLEPPDLIFIPGEGHRGAVRHTLTSRLLRCDNAQHFLMAALRAAPLLDDDSTP